MIKCKAIVTFNNEGDEYGRETYQVEGRTRQEAIDQALLKSEDSIYDDPRIPTPSRQVYLQE